jgi:hypothetical protein
MRELSERMDRSRANAQASINEWPTMDESTGAMQPQVRTDMSGVQLNTASEKTANR